MTLRETIDRYGTFSDEAGRALIGLVSQMVSRRVRGCEESDREEIISQCVAECFEALCRSTDGQDPEKIVARRLKICVDRIIRERKRRARTFCPMDDERNGGQATGEMLVLKISDDVPGEGWLCGKACKIRETALSVLKGVRSLDSVSRRDQIPIKSIIWRTVHANFDSPT